MELDKRQAEHVADCISDLLREKRDSYYELAKDSALTFTLGGDEEDKRKAKDYKMVSETFDAAIDILETELERLVPCQ